MDEGPGHLTASFLDRKRDQMTIQRFDKPSLQALRPEIQAALAAIAEKHGIKLQLGNISFTADGGSFSGKIEGTVEAIADAAAEKMFREAASIFGFDPDKVATTPQGEVRLVGYNPKKRTKCWLISINGKPGYVADDRYVSFYFKKEASDGPILKMDEAPPPASA